MSELLLVFNLVDSKIYNKLILETYVVHKIPLLKSKQFSGQKRKINITQLSSVNNLSDYDLKTLVYLLHENNNIQIDSYRYVINNNGLKELANFLNDKIYFYTAPDNHLYQVEKLIYHISQTFSFCVTNNNIIINLKEVTNDNKLTNLIVNFYLDLDTKEGSLFFEYNKKEINYSDIKNKKVIIEEKNYYLEKKVLKLLEKNNWQLSKDNKFIYIGKNIFVSLKNLLDLKINIFTSKSKNKISLGYFSNESISYNMDWFEIKAKISYDNQEIELKDLIKITQKKKNWVNINNNVVLLPNIIMNNLELLKNQDDNSIKIPKKFVGQVLAFSSDLGIRKIKNIEKISDFTSIEVNIDKEIEKKLKGYQLVGVKWLLYLKTNNFGGCLADDMGLGKTLQVIAYLSDRRFMKSTSLIVVSKTLLENWRREILKFNPNCNFCIYHGAKRNFVKFDKHNVVLTTYGMIINDYNRISQIEFENIIIDEAQYIKNIKTNSYLSIFNLNGKTKILLTGTPFENNLFELWTLMHLINPDIFPKKPNISINYDKEYAKNYIKKSISPFILRRMKNEVLKELPLKEEKTIYCSMDSEQERLYKDLLNSIKYELLKKSSRFEIKSPSIYLEGLLYLQQTCCNPKLLPREINPNRILESCKTDVLMNMITDLIQTGHKIVIFSRFTKMLAIIKELIEKNNIRYYYLDGKTTNRLDIVEEFENNNEGVFLVSLKAGGVGLTLASADTAIIYDPWWNPAVEKQAEDRIYRIGQTKNVTIYRLIVSGTIEEKIEDLKNKKRDLANTILENENTVTNLNLDTIKNLILY